MSETAQFSSTRWSVAFALAGVLGWAALVSTSPGLARAPESLSGRATVIDGDTLKISHTHIRLEGIDAPEKGQTCARAGIGSWKCGTAATEGLKKMLAGRRVNCQSRGHDKYDRVLGVCFVDGRDINAEMVRTGLAWAFVKYSQSYVDVEAEARAKKAGVWRGKSEPPWDFRKKRWAAAEQKAPDGCAIKGNVTSHGHIYHMPWSPWYGKVRITAAKGERWFCTEAEAKAAGWRPAAS
jgi:endonuclease YncB( thermonuclease family)